MKPRKPVLAICLASLALLFSLLAVPTASAERPNSAPYGPIDREGPWLGNPGGGAGDGGDPDEYLLVDHPGHAPQTISDSGRNLTGEQAISWDFLRFRIWWMSFLFNVGMIH